MEEQEENAEKYGSHCFPTPALAGVLSNYDHLKRLEEVHGMMELKSQEEHLYHKSQVNYM